jgi:hypothetical protein
VDWRYKLECMMTVILKKMDANQDQMWAEMMAGKEKMKVAIRAD